MRRSEGDHGAYDALPYGRNSGRGPLSGLLTPTRTDVGAGQARLFVHPELLLDAARTRVFHFAADPVFAKRQDAFRRELHELLLKEYPSYTALRKGSCQIRDIPFSPLPSSSSS